MWYSFAKNANITILTAENAKLTKAFLQELLNKPYYGFSRCTTTFFSAHKG